MRRVREDGAEDFVESKRDEDGSFKRSFQHQIIRFPEAYLFSPIYPVKMRHSQAIQNFWSLMGSQFTSYGVLPETVFSKNIFLILNATRS